MSFSPATTVADNTSVQKIKVSKAGTLQGTRDNLNLIEGSNVTLTVADNAGADRVDVTVASSGGGGGIGGSIAATQVAYGSGVDTIAGSNNLTWDNTNRVLTTLGVIASTGTTGSTPVSGAGTRMMWIPDKQGLRAGSVNGTQWDDANIGTGSVACGNNTLASGSSSAAFNQGQATGTGAFAINSGVANGYESFAGGAATTTQDYTFGFGFGTQVTGTYATAIGYACTASNFYSIALGAGSTSSGSAAVAFSGATASGGGSFASGSSVTASGASSVAIGNSMTVSGDYSYGINLSNTNFTLSQNNTFSVMNGKIGFGTLTPKEKFAIKNHANFAGSEDEHTTAAVSTTDATIITLYSKTLLDDTVYYYHVDIVARRSDSGTENGRFTREFLVYRQGGGGATLGASTVIPWTDEQLTMAGTITVDTSTNDIRVRVTGENMKTIQWVATIRYQAVSGSA